MSICVAFRISVASICISVAVSSMAATGGESPKAVQATPIGSDRAASRTLVMLSPADGAIVSQLNDVQARLVRESMEEREKYFDGAANAKTLRDAKSNPKPVQIAWKGGCPPYAVKVVRILDGKTFLDLKDVKGHHAAVDSLEIARRYLVEVTDKDGVSASAEFQTEDQAPRLIRIKGVPNVRDIGGRVCMDGRRIRQGLLFRSGGLNDNAPIDYYSVAEIKNLHKEGKLAAMGAVGKNHARQLDAGVNLSEKDMRLVKRDCYAKGRERLTNAERIRIQHLYGFRTDIDFRSDRECYGMTGSPLGSDVAWRHVELVASYGAFTDERYFDCYREIFRTLFDRASYPVVFHCIAGADRTGTIAFMVEALLGLDENQLALDYLTTGLASGVTDAKHRRWFGQMMDSFRKLPGATPQEKLTGHMLRLGFTQSEIDGFREFMLER